MLGNSRQPLRGKSGLNTGNQKLSSTQGGLKKPSSQLSKGKASSLSTDAKLSKGQAKSGSTRLLGDREELRVKEALEAAGLEVSETKNSGATNFDGDLTIVVPGLPDGLRAEVKHRQTEGFSMTKEHWTRIKEKALMHGGSPAYVFTNKRGERFITLMVEDFGAIASES